MVLDIVVILLLCMTVAFCWRLNNKIIELKESRKDLAELVKVFDNAIIQTHKSLAALREASLSSASQLESYTKISQELISDLSFMTSSASKLADRLESALANGKMVEQSIAIKKTVTKKANAKGDKVVSSNKRPAAKQATP